MEHCVGLKQFKGLSQAASCCSKQLHSPADVVAQNGEARDFAVGFHRPPQRRLGIRRQRIRLI